MTSITIEFKEIVAALQRDNQELREMITEQDAALDRAISAIYQLHGGLYNQQTQRYILESSDAMLCRKELPSEPEEPYNVWPTTRQGDEHEERITKLEKTIELLQLRLLSLEEKITVK